MRYQIIYGLSFIALLAVVSYFIADLTIIRNLGISSLVVSIVLGIFIGNSWHHPTSWHPGIQFAAKQLLRLAIILYGFRISFQQIASVGVNALLLDIFVVIATLILG